MKTKEEIEKVPLYKTLVKFLADEIEGSPTTAQNMAMRFMRNYWFVEQVDQDDQGDEQDD